MKFLNIAQNDSDNEEDFSETNWYKTFQQIKSQIQPNDRIHISDYPELNFNDSTSKLISHFKPKGLWYAIGDEWMNFLTRAMQPSKDATKHIFKITINPSAMVMITNANDLEVFGYKYGVKEEGFREIEINKINWTEVSRNYNGIEISPYIGSMRMSDIHQWYYPWDVASGCIWSVGALSKIEKLT